jgi:peroxiredoxin (alkyl hydroperoxide reductase subunit C)
MMVATARLYPGGPAVEAPLCESFLIAHVYQIHRIARLALSGTPPHGGAMLTIGDTFPTFTAKAVVSLDRGREFETLSDQSFAGKWKVYFFWPKDFTFVCPTEIAAFGKLEREFADRDAQVLGVSTDSEYVHLAWRQQHPDLRDLPFPMIADLKRELAQALGVLDRHEGVALRATFIVDPHGVIRFVSVNDLAVGRNPGEVLRVLDALQTDELCPCNWHKGEATLSAA